jgi:uncharacterized LabA/DUF88 family protein
MSLGSSNQVAVFIDYENIELSCREKLGSDVEVDWSQVLETAVDLGRLVIRRAYADWSTYGASQRELLGLGIDLIHIPTKRGKNAADIRIVIDVMEMLLIGEHANISHVMLISGDGDFTELVHRLRSYGKIVIGLGVSGASAEYLINACDRGTSAIAACLAAERRRMGDRRPGQERHAAPQSSLQRAELRLSEL